MSAPDRFTRIVSLVASLTRRSAEPDESVAVDELAMQHGVSPQDITADIRALTNLGEDADADWLLSLSVWQQGDRVAVSSRGPFRRPIRLSPEEQLAIQVALAMDGEGTHLATRLGAFWSGETSNSAPNEIGSPADVVRSAIHERQALEIEYAGEKDAAVRTRIIHPYQMVEAGVRTYVVAFSPDVGAWRNFRLDRILTVRPADVRFEVRDDFAPVETVDRLFVLKEVDRVKVRFSAAAAPWAAEYFTDHEMMDDGSVVVPFPATSPEWLTRRVLEFGTDAEVLEPDVWREAVRRAVA